MFDNYFFLKRLTHEIDRELKGLKFFKSVSQSKNEIVTGFFNESKEKYLVFTFQKLPPLIYVRTQFTFAKKNYVDFFHQLSNLVLKNVSIDLYERNIRFEFDDFKLIFLFRGNHSNVVLIDRNGLIIESFKKPNERKGKYLSEIFPEQKLDLSFFEDEEKFNSLFEKVSEYNKIYLRIIGQVIIKEIKLRSSKFDQSYFHSFKQILSEFESFPLYIYDDGLVSFCRFNHTDSNFKISESFFEEVGRIYFTFQRNDEVQTLKEKVLKKLRSDYEYHFKKLQELKKPENFIDKSEEYRRIGNLILINANRIKKGDKDYSLEFEGEHYKIRLDTKKSPFQNAEFYFQKAREEESRISSINKMIKKVELELEKIQDQLEDIENSTNLKQLSKYMNNQNQKIKEKEITKHFRHFIIEGKYDVYVGKDGKSNDLLTTQFAKPNDLWFHARGVSGSHLIIRRSNKKEAIPRNVIEKAAAIAAYYSKAKHSKLVPVSYTEKKYVIKRKEMSTGTVQLQKEQVIMVEPKLPEQILEDNQ